MKRKPIATVIVIISDSRGKLARASQSFPDLSMNDEEASAAATKALRGAASRLGVKLPRLRVSRRKV